MGWGGGLGEDEVKLERDQVRTRGVFEDSRRRQGGRASEGETPGFFSLRSTVLFVWDSTRSDLVISSYLWDPGVEVERTQIFLSLMFDPVDAFSFQRNGISRRGPNERDA